jgi:hypothetical protein
MSDTPSSTPPAAPAATPPSEGLLVGHTISGLTSESTSTGAIQYFITISPAIDPAPLSRLNNKFTGVQLEPQSATKYLIRGNIRNSNFNQIIQLEYFLNIREFFMF